VYYYGIGLPESRLVREEFLNGEIHFIIPESFLDATKNKVENLNEAKIRKIMKKEAARPLLLLREE
jgi:hypothetical protein